jgi:hypothetical protein
VIAVVLGGCASDEVELSEVAADAAAYGDAARPATRGHRELLPLPPGFQRRTAISNPYYRRFSSAGPVSEVPVPEDDPEPVRAAPTTGAGLSGGNPLARSPLFPRDDRSELSDAISLAHEPTGSGALARSGRVVAGEEDIVFQAGHSGRLDLLRPPESAVTLDSGSPFYGEALRRGDMAEVID